MRATSLQIVSISLAAAVSAACAGSDTPDADTLNDQATSSPSGSDAPAAGGAGPTVPGMVTPPPVTGGPPGDPTVGPPTPVTSPTPGGSQPPAVVPVGPDPDPEAEPQPGPEMMGGGGTPPVPTEGTGGTPVNPGPEPMGGGNGNVGIGGMPDNPAPIVEPTVPVEPVDPIYGPREGSFKMLAYSKTAAFRHTGSINSGKVMLSEIAAEQGFEVVFTETNEDITPEGLLQYEIVFFMNSTGDIFNNTEQQAYEDWMQNQNGAFAGVHSATDTENGWAFYSEVTGQYYDLHESCCSVADIQWDPDALNHITVQGLPSPWPRSEEWYNFDRNAEWSTKAGFQILGRVTVANKTRPVSYIREWGNFRSFYTSLGHEEAAFEDANVKKHVAAGIMWAVRREHLLQ